MRATPENQIKGEAFESELANIFKQHNLPITHHSMDDSNDENKFEIDFIHKSKKIGIDAKWTGTQMHFRKYRTLKGKLYEEHEVFTVWLNNVYSYYAQKEKYGLDEAYFVYKIEINGHVDYRVVSLSKVNEIYLRGGKMRSVVSQEKYSDPRNGFRERRNERIIIFPEDTISLDEFLLQLKEGE